MNLTDLRTQLTRQAESIDAIGDLPLVAVRRRAAVVRRRRASIAIVGMAVLITTAAVGGSLGSPDSALQPAGTPTSSSKTPPDDGLPARVPPNHPKDYVRDDFRFGYKFGSQTLNRAIIGTTGQTAISFHVTPSAAELPVDLFCFTNNREGMRIELLVDGEGFAQGFEKTCSEDRTPGTSAPFVGIPAGRDGWSGRSIPVTLRMVDSNGDTAVDPTARLGVAVYDKGPQRRIGPVEMPEVISYKGYDYKLGAVRRVAATKSARLEIATPAGVHMLVAGGVTSSAPYSIADTQHPPTSSTNGPGFGWLPVPARPKDKAWVQTHGGPRSGDLFIGVYAQLK